MRNLTLGQVARKQRAAPRRKNSGSLRERLTALEAQVWPASFDAEYGEIDAATWANATEEEIQQGLAHAASSREALTRLLEQVRSLEKEADAISEDAMAVSGEASEIADDIENEIALADQGEAELRAMKPVGGF